MSIQSNSSMNNKNKVTMFHDGDCPLCKHEVKLMQKLDISKSIRWVDISKDKDALEKAGINSIYLGHYLHWYGRKNYEIVKERGFEGRRKGPLSGNYLNYDNIESI